MEWITKNRHGQLVLIFSVLPATMVGFNGPAAWAAPHIYNLGTLGGTQTYATNTGNAINDAGQVAGDSWTAAGKTHAFLYTGTPGAGGVMADLGTLGGTVSHGYGINSAGQVAGNADTGNGSHAFRYSGTPGAGGAMTDLGTLGGTYSTGRGINDAGQVAGQADTTPGSSHAHAFLYTGTPGAGGHMADLGTLGGPNSQGYAINNAGQVAGAADTNQLDGSIPVQHAFLYTGTPGADGRMADLGTLGGTRSWANAVNNAGQVAGGAETGQSYNGTPVSHAFLYTGTPGADGTMIDLGTLGGPGSAASGINDAGFVVGSARPKYGLAVATLWLNDAAHTIVNLDAWLDATYPSAGRYWRLENVSDINNNGLISGEGYYSDGEGGLPDGNFAFILDASALIPEPSTLALAGLALLAIVRRPRAKRA